MHPRNFTRVPPFATDLVQPFGVSLAKGVAMAETQPDGTVIVRDVPIFSEILPTDPGVAMGAREARGKAWLETAVAKTRARIPLGKRPIMTRKHIFDGPERAGEWEPTRVALAEVNPGEARWTAFGDKIYRSVADFELSKDWDFRSVEISPECPDEFASLALLRDKEPFWKYPSLRERLTPEAAGAFEAAVSIVRAFVSPQVWASRHETFGTATEVRSPTSTSTVADTRGNVTVTCGAGDGATSVTINPATGGSQSTAPQEGHMAAVETKPGDKATPSIEERMEAMAQKFYEQIAKRFEALIAGKKDGDEKPAEKKPEAAEAKPEEKKPEPKTEAAQATGGPNDQLPPAVSSARGQAPGPIPEQFAARMATLETANTALRAAFDKSEREKLAVSLVAEGRKTLSDMGVPTPSEAFEARMKSAAISGGMAGVDLLLEDVKLAMGMAGRAPETYGMLAGGSGPGASPFEAEVKKAVETFGARPESRQRINDLASQFRAQGEHFVRSLAPGEFFKTAQGIGAINPQIHEAYGGLKPTYDPFTGQRSV